MANKYFRTSLIPSAATETTLYTVPAANAAIIRSLRVSNAVTVTQYNEGSATAHYLQKSRSLAVNATFDVFNGIPCVLEAGDVLKVTSTVATSHFYLSYLEIDRN